jgi:VWFA-related protein
MNQSKSKIESRRMGSVLALVAAVSCWGDVAWAQVPPAASQPGVFGETVDVRLVNIEVVVTDRRNERVTGLLASDFRLTVDGKELPIEFFSEVRGGEAIEVGTGGTVQGIPEVVAGTQVGTSYLVFVDDYFAIQRDRDRVLRGFIAGLGALGPQDRMAIVAWDGRKLEMLSSWSQSIPQLERAFQAGMKRPAFGLQRQVERQSNDRDERLRPRDNVFGSRLGGRLDASQLFYAERLTDQVQSSVGAAAATLRSFAAPPGRKVMLLLSGGWPYSPAEFASVEPNRPVLEPGLPTGDQLFRPLADNANVLGYTLYPVDVPGLVGDGADASEGNLDEATLASDSNRNREQEVQVSLTFLARETGGRALINANRDQVLTAVAADTRSYYWLGFTPDRKGDDRRHQVEVDVLRPGLKVRSREDFQDVSRTRKVSMQVESALLFGNPPSARALPISIGKPTKAGMGTMHVPLTLSIAADALSMVPFGDEFVAELELRVAAMDDNGRRSEIPVIPFKITAKHLPQPGQVVRYETTLELRKDRQELVVAVLDVASGTMLSATAEVSP